MSSLLVYLFFCFRLEITLFLMNMYVPSDVQLTFQMTQRFKFIYSEISQISQCIPLSTTPFEIIPPYYHIYYYLLFYTLLYFSQIAKILLLLPVYGYHQYVDYSGNFWYVFSLLYL